MEENNTNNIMLQTKGGKLFDSQCVLSVIIPTYNAEAFIKRTLTSILEQKNCIFKIILIDDCSTDNTVVCIQEAFNQAIMQGIILIKTLSHNSGPSIARQERIKAVTTPYFTFVDADDYYLSDMALAQMTHILTQESPDLLMFKYATLHGHLKLKKNYNFPIGLSSVKAAMTAKINRPHPIWHYIWNKCYKTSIVQKHKITFNPNVRSAEDVYFNDDYLMNIHSVYFLNQYLYLYDCSNATSLTRSQTCMTEQTYKDYISQWNRETERYEKLLNCIKQMDCYNECIKDLRQYLCVFIYKVFQQVKEKKYANDLHKVLESYHDYNDIIKEYPHIKRKYMLANFSSRIRKTVKQYIKF